MTSPSSTTITHADGVTTAGADSRAASRISSETMIPTSVSAARSTARWGAVSGLSPTARVKLPIDLFVVFHLSRD
jgi:hypothetical protein